jgi:hypothetical protein
LRDYEGLNELVGHVVGTVRPVHDYFQVEFLDGSILSLFNLVKVDSRPFDLVDPKNMALALRLVGQTVEQVIHDNDRFVLRFSSGNELSMSLVDEDWNGPEALTLRRPGAPTIVIN